MTAFLTRLLALVLVFGIVVPIALGSLPARAQEQEEDDECEIVDGDNDDDDDGDDDEGEEDQLDGFCNDQAIVRLDPNAEVGPFMREYGLTVLRSIRARRTFLVRFAPTPDDARVARRLDRDERTVWVELNYADQAPEGRPRYIYTSAQTSPGDPQTAYAPGLLGVPDASCVDGTGVAVAVVDTGVQASHPAFAHNTVAAGANFVDLDNPQDTSDPATGRMGGHGTHVAGIVDQVAAGATIVPVKALDADGFGNAFYLAQAIDFASREADVINLSLGSTFDSRAVREAVRPAVASGDILVAAAGNSGAQTPTEYPASLAAVLSVASTDADDRRSDFSNFNDLVDLSAPGTEIVSAFPDGQYRTWSGTSMAAPWVAGAAALLLDRGVDASRVEARLENAADPIAGDAMGMGAGRLDVGQAARCGSA